MSDNEKLFEWEGNVPIGKGELTATHFLVMAQEGRQSGGVLKVLTAASGKPKPFKWTARHIGSRGGQDRWVVAGINGAGVSAGKAKESTGPQFVRDRISDFSIRMFICDRLREFHHNGNAVSSTSQPDNADDRPVSQTIRVRVSEIQVFNGQPREEFDDGVGMAESLDQEGQLQDIIVTPLEGVPGKKWELVDGERRIRGAILSGTKWVDVKVRHFKDKAEQYWLSFVANLQRANHTPLEFSNAVAKAFAIGKTLHEICRATGRKEHQVREAFRLQQLAPSLRLLLRRNIPQGEQMRIGVARVLSKILSQDIQRDIWEEARKQGTPGLIQLKVDELAAPHLVKSPNRGRRSKPSDKAARMVRIIRTAGTDMVFLDSLADDDIRAFLGKDPSATCPPTVKSVNDFVVSLDRLKRRLLKVSHDKKPS